MFQKMKLFKKTSYISGGNFPGSKKVKFQEIKLPRSKLKKLIFFVLNFKNFKNSYISGRSFKAPT